MRCGLNTGGFANSAWYFDKIRAHTQTPDSLTYFLFRQESVCVPHKNRIAVKSRTTVVVIQLLDGLVSVASHVCSLHAGLGTCATCTRVANRVHTHRHSHTGSYSRAHTHADCTKSYISAWRVLRMTNGNNMLYIHNNNSDPIQKSGAPPIELSSPLNSLKLGVRSFSGRSDRVWVTRTKRRHWFIMVHYIFGTFPRQRVRRPPRAATETAASADIIHAVTGTQHSKSNEWSVYALRFLLVCECRWHCLCNSVT